MNSKIVYLDTSLALFSITDSPHKDTVIEWLQRPGFYLVSSRLFQTEVIRSMYRDERPLSEATPLLERVQLIQITDAVFNNAEAIKMHTKALDAIHLGTAATIEDPFVFATHDKRMRLVAKSLGFAVVDPLEEATA